MNSKTSYAPRITLTWDEFQVVAPAWAERCESLAVFEHPADTNTQSTHLHLLMLGCEIKAEQFKRTLKGLLPGITTTGNKLWQWESKQTPDNSFLTYMSKGVHAPKYVKNFSEELVAERRSQWILQKEKWVLTPNAQAEKPFKYDEYSAMKQQFFAEHPLSDLQYMQFETVRKWVFCWYWKRDARVPIPTCYKRNSSSLMIAIGEKINKFDDSVNQVFNLWY